MASQTIASPGGSRAVAAADCPLPTNPATITLPIADRLQIEAAIETLIELLDQQDGSSDAEPDADMEPDEAPGFRITPAGRRALAAARS